MSLPSRGAWIEMLQPLKLFCRLNCRSPHGERGLKLVPSPPHAAAGGVAPLTGSVD